MWTRSSLGRQESGHGTGGVPSVSGGAASIWRPAKLAMRSLMGSKTGASPPAGVASVDVICVDDAVGAL